MLGRPRDAHVSADRLRQDVVAALRRVRPVLTERGDRRVDEAGVERLQVLVAEPQSVHRADTEVLGDDVRMADQLLEELYALRRFQLERDRELVPLPVL